MTDHNPNRPVGSGVPPERDRVGGVPPEHRGGPPRDGATNRHERSRHEQRHEKGQGEGHSRSNLLMGRLVILPWAEPHAQRS